METLELHSKQNNFLISGLDQADNEDPVIVAQDFFYKLTDKRLDIDMVV